MMRTPAFGCQSFKVAGPPMTNSGILWAGDVKGMGMPETSVRQSFWPEGGCLPNPVSQAPDRFEFMKAYHPIEYRLLLSHSTRL